MGFSTDIFGTYDTVARREDLNDLVRTITAPPPANWTYVTSNVSGATVSGTLLNNVIGHSWNNEGDLIVEQPEQTNKEEMVSLLETLLPYGRFKD